MEEIKEKQERRVAKLENKIKGIKEELNRVSISMRGIETVLITKEELKIKLHAEVERYKNKELGIQIIFGAKAISQVKIQLYMDEISETLDRVARGGALISFNKGEGLITGHHHAFAIILSKDVDSNELIKISRHTEELEIKKETDISINSNYPKASIQKENKSLHYLTSGAEVVNATVYPMYKIGEELAEELFGSTIRLKTDNWKKVFSQGTIFAKEDARLTKIIDINVELIKRIAALFSSDYDVIGDKFREKPTSRRVRMLSSYPFINIAKISNCPVTMNLRDDLFLKNKIKAKLKLGFKMLEDIYTKETQYVTTRGVTEVRHRFEDIITYSLCGHLTESNYDKIYQNITQYFKYLDIIDGRSLKEVPEEKERLIELREVHVEIRRRISDKKAKNANKLGEAACKKMFDIFTKGVSIK